MTDRELLEAAAKAADIQISDHIGLFYDYFIDNSIGKEWNPLTDDGDALRLAVKLKIGLRFTWDGCDDQYDAVWAERGRTRFDEELGVTPKGDQFDEDAATRRAIVRAAATIGESK
jgi:hypothetical protein